MLNFTDDQKQTLNTIILLVSESFKVLMATLLAIFVPQRCDNQAEKLCTLVDNFTNLTQPFHKRPYPKTDQNGFFKTLKINLIYNKNML